LFFPVRKSEPVRRTLRPYLPKNSRLFSLLAVPLKNSADVNPGAIGFTTGRLLGRPDLSLEITGNKERRKGFRACGHVS
jgi:hypothetical protein